MGSNGRQLYDILKLRRLSFLRFIPDRPLALPESEAAASGLTTNHVKIKSEHGGGYPVNVEGLHHLHCLVCFRKATGSVVC